jgi:hypothetical protein
MKMIDEITKNMFRNYLQKKHLTTNPSSNPDALKAIAAKDIMFQIAMEGEADHRTLEFLTHLIRLDGNRDEKLMDKLLAATTDIQVQEDYVQLYVAEDMTPKPVIEGLATLIFAEYRRLVPFIVVNDEKWKKVFDGILADPRNGKLIYVVSIYDDNKPDTTIYIPFYEKQPIDIAPIYIKTKDYLYTTGDRFSPEIDIARQWIADYLDIDAEHIESEDEAEVKVEVETEDLGVTEEVLIHKISNTIVGHAAIMTAMDYLILENKEQFEKSIKVLEGIIHSSGYSDVNAKDIEEAFMGKDFRTYYIAHMLFPHTVGIGMYDAARVLLFGEFESGSFYTADEDVRELIFPGSMAVWENEYMYIGLYNNTVQCCSNEQIDNWYNTIQPIPHSVWFKPTVHGVAWFETTRRPATEGSWSFRQGQDGVNIYKEYVTRQINKLIDKLVEELNKRINAEK